MEHYIQLIILLAPGFIAKEIARELGNVRQSITTLDQVLNYFLYSLFALLPVMLVWDILLGIDGRITLESVKLRYILILSISAVLSGFAVGVIWQLWLKNKLNIIFKNMTSKVFGYEYIQEDSLLNYNLLDNRDHLIELIKDEKTIAIGKFIGISYLSEERLEIKIDSHPVYSEWLSNEVYSEKFPYLYSIFDITHNIEVKVYGYPEGFFSENFDITTLV